MLHYRQLDTTFYSDTMFAKVKSLKDNNCSQVFAAKHFVRVPPMPTKSDTGRLLQIFAEDVGDPDYIVFKGAKEQTGPNSAFMQTVQKLKMNICNTEPYSLWQNCCETTIVLIKKRWKQTISRKNVH